MTTDSSVPLEEMVGLPEFYHPVVSPDGSTIALYYDGSGRNELHLIDRENGEIEQVTDGEMPRNAQWHLLWAASGDRLYFHRDEDGDEQNDIFAISTDGEVERLVSPDGQALLQHATGSAVLYASDAGDQLNFYRYDLVDGESEQVTDYDQPAYSGRFGPEGGRIAYVANEAEDLENLDVYVMGADGTGKRRLDIGETGSETRFAGWFPDGGRLLVSDNSQDLRQVGIYDLAGDVVTWLGPTAHEENAVAVAPDGKRVVATRRRRGATMPVVYDVDTGTGQELSLPEGTVSFALTPGRIFADATTVHLSHSTASTRRTLYEYDLETDGARVLLEPDYGTVDPDTFIDAEYLTYESEDGLDIGGLLYDPRDGPVRAEDATGLPGVVMVHGGPHSAARRRFNLYVQFLVNRGFAVFQPNYRGSTGHGRSFKRAIHGDWGGMEQADVACGGRWLMDRDWVDEDRVAVFGGSFGGYSVYCQLTMYPTLWATGIAWIGITDLHRLYEDDMPHFQHQLLKQMGDPEENHDLWRDRSPIEHVDSIERPICMIHGVNDPRCPVSQARLFRDALEDRGWTAGEEFEYHELGDEGHGSTDIEQKIRVFRLLEDYLPRRL